MICSSVYRFCAIPSPPLSSSLYQRSPIRYGTDSEGRSIHLTLEKTIAFKVDRMNPGGTQGDAA